MFCNTPGLYSKLAQVFQGRCLTLIYPAAYCLHHRSVSSNTRFLVLCQSCRLAYMGCECRTAVKRCRVQACNRCRLNKHGVSACVQLKSLAAFYPSIPLRDNWFGMYTVEVVYMCTVAVFRAHDVLQTFVTSRSYGYSYVMFI